MVPQHLPYGTTPTWPPPAYAADIPPPVATPYMPNDSFDSLDRGYEELQDAGILPYASPTSRYRTPPRRDHYDGDGVDSPLHQRQRSETLDQTITDSARRRSRRNAKERERQAAKNLKLESQADEIERLKAALDHQECIAAQQSAEIERLQELEDPEYRSSLQKLTKAVGRETEARLLALKRLQKERRRNAEAEDQMRQQTTTERLDIRHRSAALKRAERENKKLHRDLCDLTEEHNREQRQLDR